MLLTNIRHPLHGACLEDWLKWRLTYEGGDQFINKYLQQYSKREDSDDFALRKRITPSPCFAKSSVKEIKNSIFQRMCDITRRGGSKTYKAAISGENNGVDLHGNSMDSFMGQFVLDELLPMKKVGIYIDMPKEPGNTLLESAGASPYIYVYRAEEIMSWTWRKDSADEFASVLLCDWVDDYDNETCLPCGKWQRYRHMWLQDGVVMARFWRQIDDPDKKGQKKDQQVDELGFPTDETFILDIPSIPFVIVEISNSMMEDIANHQIALLNMESSDVMYGIKANHPFYIEQRDVRSGSDHLRKEVEANDEEVEVGAVQGRAFDLSAKFAPAFIAPPGEPLRVSMEKQDKLKEDIRRLVNLALSNIKPKMASAQSKALDERGLEAGLSYIGLVLEHAERKIAKYWHMYEGMTTQEELPAINYPTKYSLGSDEDRRAAVEQMAVLRDEIPSDKLRKEISCQMAYLLVGHRLNVDEMDEVYDEIKAAKAYSANPKVINEAVINGFLSKDLAALLMGYPAGTAAKADEEHVKRATEIAEAQAKAKPEPAAGARGVADLSANPAQDVRDEKTASKEDAKTKGEPPPERGDGK